jgi:NTP pyrophosphatase (non-canonical NTP hydrolase)
MDISALQATLRQFAADRHWQPFQTPKNLAMALMVEAAELAEIFQWLTPEQSQTAHHDAAVKQHIGEEIADVLVYLLQVADHTHCDVPAAVADKLVKNARKYPPTQPLALTSLLAPTAPRAAAATVAAPAVHVLLDYENVQPTEAALRALVPGLSHVWLFHGPHQKDLARRFAGFGDQLSLVPISKTGKNALDFHLSFYVGYIASKFPLARIVVVANDKGYAPMLMHAEALGFDVRQTGAPRVAAAARTAPARKTAPAPTAPRPGRKTAASGAAQARPPAPKPAARQRPVPAKPAPAAATAAQAGAVAAKPAAGNTGLGAVVERGVSALVRKMGRPAVPVALVEPAVPASGKAKPVRAAPAPAQPAATARKLVASMRKMGDSLPTRQGRLLATLRSLLGPDATAQQALAALARLVAAGQLTVDGAGVVGYRW